MNNNIKAILLTLSASFFAVLMEALIRTAQYDSNVFTIGFLRFFLRVNAFTGHAGTSKKFGQGTNL